MHRVPSAQSQATGSHGGAPAASSSALQRGQACFHCRRRKIRCDGARPVCGPCHRGNRDDDCEYTHGQKRARAEILQESITQIERRIAELENPHQQQAESGTILLHQAYQSAPAPTQRIHSWAPENEPPLDVAEMLIDSFLAYASEFGFFLNSARFRRSALQHQSPTRPAPALLSVVYLWGLRLAKPRPLLISRSQEPLLLARALELAGKGLASAHPQRVLHTLQAEVLLAYYLFSGGRFLEGKYHVAGAVSLALSSGLQAPAGAGTGALPPVRDAVEAGERICACWAVVVLDHAWAVALAERPHLDLRQVALATPWPLETADYERGRVSPAGRSSNTVDDFFAGTPTADTGTATAALLAKATLLWQRADILVRDAPQGTPLGSSSVAFTALDNLISRFRAALPPPSRFPLATPTMARALVAAHSIAHAAALQLHHACPGSSSARAAVAAARAVLGIVAAAPLPPGGCINPIMGTVWRTACQVLMDEIATLRMQRQHAQGRARGPGDEDSEAALVALLARALGNLADFAACPLLKYQISRIQEAFDVMQFSACMSAD
ncbi:hypothetical protein GGX14DRAFT_653917 [Mycena pura]|uniref:Zn(2)-C6 fungal-type domain-containing protein n=1 Tax=Mycena pura TaxID=153505 RepID=A0AAD6VBU4_9AGAR|nr:hypothetical protein GGX14DRAFT_653917 [Mycena pura]